jgi:hypothetical protein
MKKRVQVKLTLRRKEMKKKWKKKEKVKKNYYIFILIFCLFNYAVNISDCNLSKAGTCSV